MADLDDLERLLTKLGRLELALQDEIRDLRSDVRAAGKAGRTDEAERLWTIYEARLQEFRRLQAEIQLLEAELYGARRQAR